MFTDQAVMQQIQNVMIEPPDGGATWPSGLWGQAEVVSYLNQRQNKFLKDTHFQFGIADIPATSGVQIYDLPDDWINSIRVLWIDGAGNVKELTRSDTWEADHGMVNWSDTPGTPELFFDGGKPITLRVMPAPDQDGTLQIHYVPYAALLTGGGELMTLPDEFVPAVKYGALADMFTKVARAQDPRAKYCAQRFNMGVEVARLLVMGWK